MRSDPPEPKGKLDAMLTDTTVDAVMVNGPEDVLPAWDAIEWRTWSVPAFLDTRFRLPIG